MAGCTAAMDGPGGPDLRAATDLSPPPDLLLAPDVGAAADLTTPVGTNCSLIGDWLVHRDVVVHFDAMGVVSYMGHPFATYMLSGDTFSIEDDTMPVCQMPGRYTLTFGVDCATATCALVSDPCPDRWTTFVGAWARQ